MIISETKSNNSLRSLLPQIIAVCIKNILLFGYGTTLGFPTILIPKIQAVSNNTNEPLSLSTHEISWISSIHLICVPVGCLISGFVTQKLGRKLAMQLVNIPFVFAWILLYNSTRVQHLYMALSIIGISGGLMEAPVITYVAEITEPKLRGILAATSSLAVMLGIFMEFFMGTFLYWRSIIIYNIAIPLSAFMLLFIVPESPYWLLMKNKNKKAKQSLAWLRGWSTIDAIENEFNELEKYLKTNQQTKANQSKKSFIIQHYCSRTFLIPYSLVSFTFFISNFSGMTTLQTFSVQIFQSLHSPIDSYYATFILGIFEVIGTILCVFLIPKLGRRRLTFLSTIGSTICFLIVTIYAYEFNINQLITKSQTNFEDTIYQWIPLIFLVLATFFNHIGLRLLPWVLIGEVYSLETRSSASGFSGGTGYIFSFLANKLFLNMVSIITLWGCFFTYVIITLLGTIILYIYLPETEGHTLYDIEMHFSGTQKLHKKAKLTNNITGIVNNVYVSDDNINKT